MGAALGFSFDRHYASSIRTSRAVLNNPKHADTAYVATMPYEMHFSSKNGDFDFGL